MGASCPEERAKIPVATEIEGGGDPTTEYIRTGNTARRR
jgi:hypothetical protein